MSKSSPSRIRRINKAKKPVTPKVPTAHSPVVPRALLELLESRFYRIEEAIINLQNALVTTDARGWVSHFLLEEVVKGEVKDLNDLREKMKELSDKYAERFQEERQKAESPDKQEGKVASPVEEIVLGG